ncbi:MAG: ABC-2 family transporter protein [Myxococcota bacterium]|nr:ABC-2 family transporter protein [Myxococcota bacterium]
MRGPIRLGALYRALLRISLLDQIQYRVSGAIWMIGAILEPLVFLVVWGTVAENQGGSVAGYEAGDFAAYYISMLVVNHLTFSWIMHTFQYRVQYGDLAYELLRPVHPIHNDVCANLAYKTIMLVILVPAVALLVIGFDPRFHWVAWSLATFLPALALAFATRFLIEWSLALASFWTTRILALNQLYFMFLMFLSGRIAPMDVFPGWLQSLAMALPFYWIIAFPVDLLLGRAAPAEAVRGLMVLSVWALVAALLLRMVWARASRRFTAVGA